MEPLTIFAVCSAIGAVALAYQSIQQVPQGYEWTVEYFGRYARTLKPGLSFLIPFVERVGSRVNMMEQVLEIPSQKVISRDNAIVTVDGVTFYQITHAALAAYEVSNLVFALSNLTMTNLRTVAGSLSLDEMLSKRDEINSRLLAVMDHATTNWGVKMKRIEIRDVVPSKEQEAAMASQMISERQKRAQVLEAEGIRQSQILRAEGERQSILLKADAEKQAAFMEAEARERLAAAEAKATEVLSAALDGGNVQAINYFIAQSYIAAFGKLADSQNSKTILMPWESSQMLGALGGIGEISKTLFKQAPSGAKPDGGPI